MLAASKVKMSGSEKKKGTRTQATTILVSTYDISYVRCVTGTFHVVVVQNNVREMYKKACYTCKALFWLIRKIDFFAVLAAVTV